MQASSSKPEKEETKPDKLAAMVEKAAKDDEAEADQISLLPHKSPGSP